MALVCWVTLSITRGCLEGSDSMQGSTPPIWPAVGTWAGPARDTENRPGTVDTELIAGSLLSHSS